MTTLITPVSGAPATPPDPPILYGYRDVPTRRPDGTWDFVRVPLTLEDCLHPEMGDVILESNLQEEIRNYLADVFRWKTAHDPSILVLSDTGVYWDKPHLKHHCPDVCVIPGIKQRKTNYTRFDVAEEKTRPRLMVEVVSPNTRANDVDTKVTQYHQAEVPYYVILDKEKEADPWQLRGYQWAPTHFLEMPKDERGRLWLEPVGVWLEVQGQAVQCWDGATGEALGDYTKTREELVERMAQIQAAKARADQETARADQEKAHAEQETARADHEKARADQEKVRADAESQGRMTLETRLKELEAELERLRNPGKS